MAYQTYWYKTNLPQEIIDIIIRDLESYKIEDLLQESVVIGGEVDHKKRKSKNSWIKTSHWLGGYLWYYINNTNEENFRYDLTGIDCDSIQYTQYNEGEYYNWHVDSGFSSLYVINTRTTNSDPSQDEEKTYSEDFLKINTESIRKLSFTVQLSDPDSYEGGDVQMIDDNDNLYTVPREKGTIIVFDSRTKHRVRKVTKGVRRSLVGWCVGPRWK
jgi:PKHD-type hydroxylase